MKTIPPAQILAKQINGNQRRDEMTKEQAAFAKENELIVIFAAGDDLMELRGAINDEKGCSTEILRMPIKKVNGKWEYQNLDTIDKVTHPTLFKLKITWCPPIIDVAWRIQPNCQYLPFLTYDEDYLYCIGAVIDLKQFNQ